MSSVCGSGAFTLQRRVRVVLGGGGERVKELGWGWGGNSGVYVAKLSQCRSRRDAAGNG